jgi:EAL domain-containing protein (putative c-di-GMP-specific phosphodiesterase class I)
MVLRRWLLLFGQLRPRTRLLVGSLALGLGCAAVQAGEPIDLGLKIIFDMARRHPVRTKAVMISIDDEAMRKVGPWPWPREKQAELLRRLDAAGAKRIFYDIILRDNEQPGDAELASTLRGMRAPTYLAIVALPPDSPQDLKTAFPPARFGYANRLGTIAMRFNLFRYAWEVPTCVELGGRRYPSFSTLLANQRPGTCQLATVDYASDPRSIRRISAGDFWSVHPPQLQGLDVVIGQDSLALSDQVSHPLLASTSIPGSLNLIVMADAFAHGPSHSLGSLPALLIASVALLLAMLGRTGGQFLSILAGTTVICASAGAARLYNLESTPSAGLIMLAFAAFRIALAKIRRRSASTNLHTGLSNFGALATSAAHGRDPLATLIIGNYAEIVATITPEQEEALQQQIIARLMIATGGATLYQGDDGSFAWFMPEESAGGDTLEGLYALMLAPFRVGGRSIDLTLSIGLDRRIEKNSATRLGSARAAATAAAAHGERWREYDDRTTAETVQRLSMLGELDVALTNGEVWVAYQPQLDLRSNRINSAEALVRWTHATRGDISPPLFVELAERHSRIEKLTIRVLEQAIADAARINQSGRPFRVSVNLSASLLDNKYLPEFTAALLLETKLSPKLLMLEITETAAIDIDDPVIAATLARYQAIGIALSLDDYGSGQSTLSYFKRVPASEIKIDRGFMAQITTSTADRLMVTSTIKLAHELGRTVIAEGVEDAATLDLLRSLDCDGAQGYLIGKAMPIADVE